MDQPLKAATRIAAGDDRARYDNTSMILHWTTAALVIVLWLLSQAWPWFPRHSDPRHFLQWVHISFGVCLILVLTARIVWRIGYGERLNPPSRSWIDTGAKAVHHLLYALLIAQAVLGVLYGWASKEPMTIFGLFDIDSPYPFTPEQNHTFGTLHWWVGTTIVIVAVVHAGAALFHHYVLKDDVLSRMLPTQERRRPSDAV